MSKKKRPATVANPELSKAMHALRSSSAASPHADRRQRRARDRQSIILTAMKEAA